MKLRALAAAVTVLLGGARADAVPGANGHGGPPEVVDLHVDLSYRANYGKGTVARGSGQFVAAALRPAGLGTVVLPLFVPHRVSPDGPHATDYEASYTKLVALLPETKIYAKPGCAAEGGPVRTLLAFEGAAFLASDPEAVEKWVLRGVRVFGLVHTSDNALATSASTMPRAAVGLTERGRNVVARVLRAGAAVDVSHASDAATDEIIALGETAQRPIIATHSNARALRDHPRNLTDAQLRGIARTGGVVGVNFHSSFLVSEGRAQIADVVRHVKHLVEVAGEDHVALGSDFEGDITPPVGLESARDYPKLARALERAGVGRATVEKVFGRNALRVLCPELSPSAGVREGSPEK